MQPIEKNNITYVNVTYLSAVFFLSIRNYLIKYILTKQKIPKKMINQNNNKTKRETQNTGIVHIIIIYFYQ